MIIAGLWTRVRTWYIPDYIIMIKKILLFRFCTLFYRPLFKNTKFVDNIYILIFLVHKIIFYTSSKILDLRHVQQTEISEPICGSETDI